MTLLRKYVFSGFTDFERAVTLLLVLFNFENGKKALPKTYYKLFVSMKSSCPKCRVNTRFASDFAAAL
jgi:hypothetical protein